MTPIPYFADPRCARRGFSLAEFVVVMAIILILASLSLPYLQRHISQAQGVKCAQNLRSWITATQMYCGENNGKLPPSVYTAGSSADATDYLYPYLGVTTKIKAWSAYFCPSRRAPGTGYTQTSIWGTYGFNSFFSEVSLPSIAEPSRVLYAMDVGGANRWLSWSTFNGSYPAALTGAVPKPHDRRVNVVYLDGHGEAKLVSQLTWADFTRGSSSYNIAYETRPASTPDMDK